MLSQVIIYSRDSVAAIRQAKSHLWDLWEQRIPWGLWRTSYKEREPMSIVRIYIDICHGMLRLWHFIL